jgi:hypothetical protein
MAAKRAVAMATRVAGKDAGDGEGGKSDGDGGAKRAIARRRAMAGPIYKIKQNPLAAPSTNRLQRGCRTGLAINTIAMPLDQANGSTMVMFFFRVGPIFLVGHVISLLVRRKYRTIYSLTNKEISWRERYRMFLCFGFDYMYTE